MLRVITLVRLLAVEALSRACGSSLEANCALDGYKTFNSANSMNVFLAS
jgi:hypothetical protein